MTLRFPKQLFRHLPDDGVYGDCHRTVVAALLDLPPEDVPHFADNDASVTEFKHRRDAFLQKHGLAEFTVAYLGETPLDSLLEAMAKMNPGQYWILGGFSRTGTNHSVICLGGEIVHDPSLTDAGITGPMDDGFWYVSVLSRQPSGEAR